MIDLPDYLLSSPYLTPLHLQQLASLAELPTVDPAFDDETLRNIFQYYSLSPDDMDRELHTYAATLLDQKKVAEAWQILLSTNIL